DAVAQALIQIVDHGTEAEAVDAVPKLAELAERDPAAMAALRRAATSEHVLVRVAAAAALSKGEVRTLHDLLKAPEATLRATDAEARLDEDPEKAFAGAKRSEILGGPDWTPEQAARRIREGSLHDARLAIVELKWNAEKFPGSVAVLREAMTNE